MPWKQISPTAKGASNRTNRFSAEKTAVDWAVFKLAAVAMLTEAAGFVDFTIFRRVQQSIMSSAMMRRIKVQGFGPLLSFPFTSVNKGVRLKDTYL